MPDRIVVPREHGAVMILPDLASGVSLLSTNPDQVWGDEVSIGDMPLSTLRTWTRNVVFHKAVTYTDRLGVSATSLKTVSTVPDRFIVTGHQPELFHAGVWFKNFVTDAMARSVKRQGNQSSTAIGLNLLIDNDLMTASHIRIPVGTRDTPKTESLPFDAARPTQPWEEATVLDAEAFSSFGQRLHKALHRDWQFTPMAEQFWRTAPAGASLTDALAHIRATAEQAAGLENLELPMSQVCETDPFRWFAITVIENLPQWHSVYNAAVRDYRLEHGLRSQTHPVPELESFDGWHEAPFWLWSAQDQRRGRPFVRLKDGLWSLIAGHPLTGSTEPLVTWPVEKSPSRAGGLSEQDAINHPGVSSLKDLSARGFRFRSRALTTTLFVRLCLADRFVHGIGGAKYDAITNRLCEELYHRPAPPFMTASATMHLPLGKPHPVTPSDRWAVQSRLRELQYNPQRVLESSTDRRLLELMAEKKLLIGQLAHRRPTAQEHRQLVEWNRQLSAATSDTKRDLNARRQQIDRQLAANAILQDREFAWCLHPADRLMTTFRSRCE